jgi:succinate dehydrogenase (ubiquinone) cytochrome b560 subunit
MLRHSSNLILRHVQSQASGFILQQSIESVGSQAQQFRFIGGDKVPEFWGKPSHYTEGTGFLGTPNNHLDLIQKRPLSPDVIEIDGKAPHYKFPLGAVSSITNRVTGVALSVGFIGAGYISLTGNLPGLIHAIAATNPIILFPFKFAIAYTIFYHYVGAIRHFVWDHHKIGNQADKTSLLELPKVEFLSKGIFVVSGVLALVAAFM